MASQGPLYPNTAADDNTVGTLAWSNPGNILLDDGSFATATSSAFPALTQTHYLVASNFGFTIPAGAIINGILAEFDRKADLMTGNNYVQDTGAFPGNGLIKIVKGGTASGTTKKSDDNNWSTTLGFHSAGNSTELWGVTWTPADINSSGFGVALSVDLQQSLSSPTTTASVDSIRITVYYTPALEVNVFDNVFVNELITTTITQQFFDNITVSDVITDIIRGGMRDQSVSDNLTVSEFVQAQIVSPASVFDSITVAETTTPSKTTTASIVDNVTVTEAITIPGGSWLINVFDPIFVSEALTSKPAQFVGVQDNITISETVTVLIKNLVVNVSDNITVSETNSELIANLPINVSDNISVSEQIGIHRVRTGWSTNWTHATNTSSNWTQDATIPTANWKKTPN